MKARKHCSPQFTKFPKRRKSMKKLIKLVTHNQEVLNNLKLSL